MREEIITLIETATNAAAKLENYVFDNHKKFYTYTKGNIDILKDHIDNIKHNLEKLDEASLNKAKNDIQLIIDIINAAASEGLNQGQNNTETTITTEGVVENNLEFSEDELKKLLEALDNVNFETLLPDISDTSVEMPSLDTLVERNQEITPTTEPTEFPDFSSIENAVTNIIIETATEPTMVVEQPVQEVAQVTEQAFVQTPVMEQPMYTEVPMQEPAPQVQPVQQAEPAQVQMIQQQVPTQFIDSSDENFRI